MLEAMYKDQHLCEACLLLNFHAGLMKQPQMSSKGSLTPIGVSDSTSALRIDSSLFPRAFSNAKDQKKAMREEDRKHNEAITSMWAYVICAFVA